MSFSKIIFIILCAFVLAVPAAAQQDVRYYDETGHSLRGAFLAFFDSHGGLGVFGYPITESFELPDGTRVQYLQNARFELAHDQVKLADLGAAFIPPDLLKDDASPCNESVAHVRCFPQTGHSVSYSFLDFYDAHGGEDVFGVPLTDFVLEGSRIVQYFTRARFEWWYPETPEVPVRLSRLGSLDFARQNHGPELLAAAQPLSGRVRTITALKARASVAEPVIARGDEQRLYVFVTDQTGQPVKGVSVKVGTCAAGLFEGAEKLQTDARGLASDRFRVEAAQEGTEIALCIEANYDDLSAKAETAYLPWW